MKALLSAADVCALLKIGRTTLYEKLKTDPTFPRPVRDLGRHPRFRPEQLEAWVDARTEPTPAQG